MKRCFAVAATILLLGSGMARVQADDFSDNFTVNLDEKTLDALAQDVGAVLGGGMFHHGKSLGFPLGFDVGAHAVAVGVQDDNKILEDDDSMVGAAWGQVEAGLPGRINLIARAGKLFDAKLYGGGIRLGLIRPSVPGLPSLSVIGAYNVLDHDYFEMETVSANAVVSIDFPFIHPYIGVGYDHSQLDPTARAFEGAAADVSRSVEGEASGYRAELGVNLSIIPFTYISLAAGVANGQELYHAGAGVRF